MSLPYNSDIKVYCVSADIAAIYIFDNFEKAYKFALSSYGLKAFLADPDMLYVTTEEDLLNEKADLVDMRKN